MDGKAFTRITHLITTNGGRVEIPRDSHLCYHHRNLSQEKTGRCNPVGQAKYTALQAVKRIKFELSKLRVESDEQDNNSPEIFDRGFHRGRFHSKANFEEDGGGLNTDK